MMNHWSRISKEAFHISETPRFCQSLICSCWVSSPNECLETLTSLFFIGRFIDLHFRRSADGRGKLILPRKMLPRQLGATALRNAPGGQGRLSLNDQAGRCKLDRPKKPSVLAMTRDSGSGERILDARSGFRLPIAPSEGTTQVLPLRTTWMVTKWTMAMGVPLAHQEERRAGVGWRSRVRVPLSLSRSTACAEYEREGNRAGNFRPSRWRLPSGRSLRDKAFGSCELVLALG